MIATNEKLAELTKLEQGIKSWHNFWQSKDKLQQQALHLRDQ